MSCVGLILKKKIEKEKRAEGLILRKMQQVNLSIQKIAVENRMNNKTLLLCLQSAQCKKSQKNLSFFSQDIKVITILYKNTNKFISNSSLGYIWFKFFIQTYLIQTVILYVFILPHFYSQ